MWLFQANIKSSALPGFFVSVMLVWGWGLAGVQEIPRRFALSGWQVKVGSVGAAPNLSPRILNCHLERM